MKLAQLITLTDNGDHPDEDSTRSELTETRVWINPHYVVGLMPGPLPETTTVQLYDNSTFVVSGGINWVSSDVSQALQYPY